MILIAMTSFRVQEDWWFWRVHVRAAARHQHPQPLVQGILAQADRLLRQGRIQVLWSGQKQTEKKVEYFLLSILISTWRDRGKYFYFNNVKDIDFDKWKENLFWILHSRELNLSWSWQLSASLTFNWQVVKWSLFQNSSLRGNSAYEQDSKVQFVIDAVYAFANALQSLKNDMCPRAKGMCQQMKMVDGGYFYKNYLLKTSFIGECNQQLASRKLKTETKSLRKIPF